MSKEKNTLTVRAEWVQMMKKLPGEDFKELFLSIWNHAVEGAEPSEFSGNAGIVADVLFALVEKDVKKCCQMKRAAELRWTQNKQNNAENRTIHNTNPCIIDASDMHERCTSDASDMHERCMSDA